MTRVTLGTIILMICAYHYLDGWASLWVLGSVLLSLGSIRYCVDKLAELHYYCSQSKQEYEDESDDQH